MLNKLCPECFDVTSCQVVTKPKVVEIHGESIEFAGKYLMCTNCNTIIPDNTFEQENYLLMYNEYRKKRGMMLPEEFYYLRTEVYGDVSQRTLAKLFGMSHATLSRFENGALQSQQQDNQLSALKDLEHMKFLFEKNKALLSEKEAVHLGERLDFLIEVKKSMGILSGMEDAPTFLEPDNTGDLSLTQVEEVEQYFIIKGQLDDEEFDEELRISPLKLQKLLYYSQGWSLAYTGVPLFDNDFEAWKHGPVIPDTYNRYKDFRYQSINRTKKQTISQLKLSSYQVSILNWVWDCYSKYEAKYLEHLTHQERPWRISRGCLPDDAPCNNIIPKEEMKAYFSSLLKNMRMLQTLTL